MPPPDLDPLNQREFRKLVLSIEASAQRLGLLLAICDDRNLQDKLITTYEAELKDRGITPFRARLDLKQPSLRATLAKLEAQEPTLRTGEPAVVTVLNANELLGVRLTDDKSEQERFFFSLQWTREALRQFNVPIVLWLSDGIATRLSQEAKDFWSWRSGVFEFVAQPPAVITSPSHLAGQTTHPIPIEQDSQIPIEDLKQQIAELEKTSPESPLLITLYNTLGKAYEHEYAYRQALQLYEQALSLAEAKQDSVGQARALFNLGDSLRYCGRPFQTLDFYEQALALYQGNEDRSGEASSLGNLGIAYYSLGQYQRAIEFYQQSLEITRNIGDLSGEANSLMGLGIAYYSLGQYQRAIEFHQQSLEITRNIGDRNGEAKSLNNLGNAYYLLGQYQQAIEFYQQSLEIQRDIGDLSGKASSLNNLGNAYDSLGQYQQAIEFYQQSLEIQRDIGDRKGEAASLGNLGNAYYSLGQYQQTIDFQQRSLEIKRDIGDRHGEANAYFNSGLALSRLEKHTEAQASFEAAREIFLELGLQNEVERCNQQVESQQE
ncbi:MAG: tetratricopeptide repeat protein [Cyanobacteria bacterium P01_A01_bin.123]